MTNKELDEHFEKIRPQLSQISSGQLQTKRSKAYTEASPGQRHQMFYKQIQFSNLSYKYLYERVTKKAQNDEERTFFDTVLLYELHLRICMAVIGKTYDEAECFMLNDYLVRL